MVALHQLFKGFLVFTVVYTTFVIIFVTYTRLQPIFDWRLVGYEHTQQRSNNLPFQLTTNYWSATNIDTSFFAAYFDDRDDPLRPSLVLMGAHSGSLHRPLFCQPFYEDSESTSCLPITRRYFSADRNIASTSFHSYRYICRLQKTTAPVFVRVFDDKECVVSWGNQTLIPVTSERPKVRKPFGLCVGSPVFEGKGLEEIVHAIESNRILGSQWFTVYIQDVAEDIVAGLKTYEKLGDGEIIDTWSSEGAPTDWSYNGQLLANNDCLYRNMFRVDYLVITDLDELIVPGKSLSWKWMMSEIDTPGYGAFMFRHRTYVPRRKFQISALVVVNISQCSDGHVLEVPRCLEYNKKAKLISRYGKKCKVFVKPRSVNSIAISHVNEFHDPKLKYLRVPMQVGLLRHFRHRKAYKSDAPHTYDPSLNAVATELMRNIHGILCDKMQRQSLLNAL